MIALSVRQPWAWLIVRGFKDVENRSWQTNYRGRFLLHASSTMRMADYRVAAEFARRLGVAVPHPQTLERGGIIGAATLVDCVRSHRSKWFFGEYGFVLADQRQVPFIPCPGQLKLFHVEQEVADQLREWWQLQPAGELR